MDLTGRTVLVTGAAGRLGVPVARELAATGANLALTSHNAQRLEELADHLGLVPERLFWRAADLADPGEVEALVAAVDARWGGVDALANLVGGWAGGKRLADLTLDEWEASLSLNLRTALLVNRAVLPHMLAQGWGRIVNVAGKAAAAPGARQAAYNVSKAGVVALTQSIAQDYGRSGIVANVILPSIIDSPEARASSPSADPSRWVTPEQIAAMVRFLCSEAAAALNGASIPMYGRV